MKATNPEVSSQHYPMSAARSAPGGVTAYRHRGRRLLGLFAVLPLIGAACTGFDYLMGPYWNQPAADTTVQLAVSVVQPAAAVTATPGVTTVIQWADIAKVTGTSVRVSARRENSVGEATSDVIHLIGDGTPGSGRDAVADGNNDVYVWDITGVRVGDYVITVTIEAPDGTTATAVSRDLIRGTTGVIRIVTGLPAPTLTFTAPGAADETVNVGNTFDITWTDNGTANAEARVVLGLDPDSDHESGNEIVLLRDAALSDNDDTGTFTFSFVDENGGNVPTGTYTVYAIVDDGVNNSVTSSATGKLILAP